MITIDIADLVVIAAALDGTGPATALDRIDIAAAHTALTEAALTEAVLAKGPAALTDASLSGTDASLSGTDASLTAGALAAAATRLIRALLRHQPFPAHGHQLAVLAALQLLAVNGWQADLDPPGTALVLVKGLSSGRLSPADAAAWLSPRLSPYSASPAREIPMRTRMPGRRLFRAVDPRPRAGVWTPATGFIPFNSEAGEVVVQARQQTIQLGPGHEGSEDFLLALIATGQSVAAQVLRGLGIGVDAVREQLAQVTAQHRTPMLSGPDIPLAVRVMPRAVGEAVAHGHDYIGTEHILLAHKPRG